MRVARALFHRMDERTRAFAVTGFLDGAHFWRNRATAPCRNRIRLWPGEGCVCENLADGLVFLIRVIGVVNTVC
ncbi:hypothetical protein RLO149_c025410 [Roseobacter litoralis Och 149]|uniref:Uncharacterized protein n=1 Tax=Roseobacter litoralis (strain ATCC 49566 / DSM 6996 / JCM 21268 / NBRC 15278 / OCh 149) TaxID=391595 RepID=F7ZCT5_ROSLO|nr:hypothetical protein RLO149_c025410 [Roseobacter litoralis Och 149]